MPSLLTNVNTEEKMKRLLLALKAFGIKAKRHEIEKVLSVYFFPFDYPEAIISMLGHLMQDYFSQLV